ncbi:unnamed protein product, partial [Aureobasidium uvarum]
KHDNDHQDKKTVDKTGVDEAEQDQDSQESQARNNVGSNKISKPACKELVMNLCRELARLSVGKETETLAFFKAQDHLLEANLHFDVQLYVLNHQQSLKNNNTVWHRDEDGSFRAVAWTSRFMYLQDRKSYLDRDGHVDHEWADEKWRLWSERDFHPAVEAYVEYNEPGAEMIALDKVTESVRRTNDAVKDIWAELTCAKKTLEFAVLPPNSRDPDHLPTALKAILEDLTTYLRTIDTAQQESKERLKSLDLAVKSLIRSTYSAERSRKRREEDDEKMIDTVRFLKKCLDNHCRLFNMILGKPEPLVQQGTDLIQTMLSEMFGLPLPAIEEVTEEPRAGREVELESESEVEVIWEKFESQDLMDSDEYIGDTSSEETESTPETSKHCERALRREKRERLYDKFGFSIIHDDAEDLESSGGEERSRTKRQKRLTKRPNESPMRKLSTRHRTPVMRQTTLSFHKVRKSRRLFSRKELSQNVSNQDQEEAEVTSPGPIRRNPRKAIVEDADYRDGFQSRFKRILRSGAQK